MASDPPGDKRSLLASACIDGFPDRAPEPTPIDVPLDRRLWCLFIEFIVDHLALPPH